MISGHIHKPFVWKNYLCLGSVWATHPQEYNQTKVVMQRAGGRGRLVPLAVNFYASVVARDDEPLTDGELSRVQQDAWSDVADVMSG